MHVEKSSYPTIIALRNDPLVKGTLIDPGQPKIQKTPMMSPLNIFKAEFSAGSKISDYRNQLQDQGMQEQSMVVTKAGQVVGSIGQNGETTFQDSSLMRLWQDADQNPEIFADLLKQNGYGFENYNPGNGPSYAEIHQWIHGESYVALVERQTAEYYKGIASNAGGRSLLNISA